VREADPSPPSSAEVQYAFMARRSIKKKITVTTLAPTSYVVTVDMHLYHMDINPTEVCRFIRKTFWN